MKNTIQKSDQIVIHGNVHFQWQQNYLPSKSLTNTSDGTFKVAKMIRFFRLNTLLLQSFLPATIQSLLGMMMASVLDHPCVCVFSSHPFWTSSSLDVPAGVTQEEGHTGFLIHLPSAVRALIFVARRIQPFLSLVDREVEFCVLTN